MLRFRNMDEFKAWQERRLSPTEVLPTSRTAMACLSPGRMNKTERAFADRLEAQRKAGEIVSWRFEAQKFRLTERRGPDLVHARLQGALPGRQAGVHRGQGRPHLGGRPAQVQDRPKPVPGVHISYFNYVVTCKIQNLTSLAILIGAARGGSRPSGGSYLHDPNPHVLCTVL